MSAILRYVRWRGHDAGGTLAPLDVAAGVLHPGAWRPPAHWPPLGPDETLVLVPPQWVGGWEDGHPLAPGYQHIWRALLEQLTPPPDPVPFGPYRPDELPATATGPSRRNPWRRGGRR